MFRGFHRTQSVLVTLAIALIGCERRPPSSNGSLGVTAGANADVVVVDPEAVTFGTADGWTLHGDLRLRGERNNIGVVFVHQLSSNRGEWTTFARQIAGPPRGASSAGTISTLAIDLRGHGDSTQGPEGPTRWQSFGNDRARWIGLEHDVAAAVDYLRQRASTTRIIVVGSSIGSTAATLFAARQGVPVMGLAMLSPGLSYRGIDLLPPLRAFVEQTHGKVWMAASGGDTASAQCVTQVERMLNNADAGTPSLTVWLYATSSAHGVSMGAEGEQPQLWTQLEQWIRSQS